MRCQLCGAERTSGDACPSCGTPSDRPALSPGMPTYPVRGIGLAAAVGVGLSTLLFTLMAVTPAVRAVLSRRAGTAVDPGLDRMITLAGGLLSLAYLVVFLTTAVLFVVWMFRARKNTDAFPGVGSSLAPHWAITGWWVPLASLVVPCVVMAGIVRDSLGRARLRGLVALWWVGWLVFDLANLFSRIDQLKADARLAGQGTVRDFDHYRDAALRNSIPLLALLVAGVSVIVLILRISTAQQERIAGGTPAWVLEPLPVGHPAPQPVTASSPQVPADPTVASPTVPPAAGGTIGA